ncbi:MAG: tetratricopeptide repeat protein [Xanthomonadales bacterium]|nr:tetratricopeptide repeat protein [Xanthomonadales bacterium]
MVEVYDSHEQSERVKNWLQENGGAIVLGLVLAFGGLFGFKQWQNWQANQDRRASAEYEVLVDLIEAGQMDEAVANYQTLSSDFEDSPYAALASLQMAGARIEASQDELAEGLLEHAMRHAKPEPLRTVARLRLARVKLDLGKADEALALLEGAPSEAGFEALFAEIRGDIAYSEGRLSEAADQYRLALDSLEAGTGNRAYLEVKLESAEVAGSGEGEAS